MKSSPPPLSELWAALKPWLGEIFATMMLIGGAIWKWRGPFATILRKLIVNGRTATPPAQALPLAPMSIAAPPESAALARLEDAQRRREQKEEADDLLRRVDGCVRAALAEVSARHMEKYQAEFAKLFDALNADKIDRAATAEARRQDVNLWRQAVAELRTLVVRMEYLTDAQEDSLRRRPGKE